MAPSKAYARFETTPLSREVATTEPAVPKLDEAAVNAAADSVFAVQGLGSHPVLLAGSEEQKRELLPKVASGAALFAFALTEPEAGSDVAALSTRARDAAAKDSATARGASARASKAT